MTAIDGFTKGILLKESLLMGNTISVNIRGKSMEPFIPEGSSLMVKAAHIDTVRSGDIILFRNQDVVVAHRLFKKVKKDGSVFLKVKADASASFDSLVSPDNLIGKVVSFEKDGRLVSLENPISSITGFFISYITLFTGYLKVIVGHSKGNLTRVSLRRLRRPVGGRSNQYVCQKR